MLQESYKLESLLIHLSNIYLKPFNFKTRQVLRQILGKSRKTSEMNIKTINQSILGSSPRGMAVKKAKM